MGYRDFELENFLTNEYFVSWVKNPDAESNYFWQHWLEQNPEKKDVVDQAKKVILAIELEHPPASEQENSEVLEGILREIDRHNATALNFRVVSNYIMKIAAAVLVLVVVYFSIYEITRDQQQPKSVKGTNEIVKTTTKGQKLNLTLPDGSSIKLNAESRLVIDSTFGKQNRLVHLQGEAYFHVSRDTVRPFIIRTNDLETRVLGTSFNINAYEGQQNIEVAVESGKVNISSLQDEQSEELTANQMLTYHQQDKKMQRKAINTLEVFGWKDNILYFRDASFTTIKNKCERWFDVDFELQDQLNPAQLKESFTGTFRNESLEEIIAALAYTSKYDYRLQGDKVIVKKKN
ncbi:MAG: FecR family protein [Cyclobacteriaceae bacterium]